MQLIPHAALTVSIFRGLPSSVLCGRVSTVQVKPAGQRAASASNSVMICQRKRYEERVKWEGNLAAESTVHS